VLASAAERPAVDTTNTVQSIGRRGSAVIYSFLDDRCRQAPIRNSRCREAHADHSGEANLRIHSCLGTVPKARSMAPKGFLAG